MFTRNEVFRQQSFKGGRIEDLYFMLKYLKHNFPENNGISSAIESYIRTTFQYVEVKTE